MRRPLSALLTALLLVLIAPPTLGGATADSAVSRPGLRIAAAAPGLVARDTSPPQRFPVPVPVGLTVSAGYHEQYRPSAWVPVRVTLRNRTSAQLAGTVVIPDGGEATQFSQPSFSSLYSQQVVLPAGGTKEVTLYLPGTDVGDAVNVEFRLGAQVIARGMDSPSGVSEGTVTIGTLAGDPQVAAWVRAARPAADGVAVIGLSQATVDPVAEALATFDAIALTNANSARLTRDQLTALERYVRNRGLLVLVGGPDWQETLRPLPAALVPGTLAGSRTVENLAGLRQFGASGIPRRPTVISRLTHVHGYVAAQQDGIPLIVHSRVGAGRIIYLAFDPAVDPVAAWRGARTFATALVQEATPQVMNRLSVSGFRGGFFRGRFGPSIIRQELANVQGAVQPTLLLLVVLVLASILVLGPLNFLLFRRMHRPELAWLALPALAVALLAASVWTTLRFKGNLVLLNTVGVIDLTGRSQSHPAAIYVGLFSSVRGAYHLVWNGRALPQGLPDYSFGGGHSNSGAMPVGLGLSEGAQTSVDFPSMNMWSMRGVALRTTVTIAGGVRANLQLTPDGSISGTVRNDTDLTLLDPAIVAGSAVLRLGNLRPHATEAVRLRPSAALHDYSRITLWDRIYNRGALTGEIDAWDGDPWEEPAPVLESTLDDRLRNVGNRLPGGGDLPAVSGVMLVGWTENPLGSLTVDGATPRRRDLNLIEAGLSVRFPHGTFQLRPGTLSPYLVEGQPQAPQNGCCASPVGPRVVGVGPGGFAVFQFDIPDVGHVRFQRLVLSVNAGGADGSQVAQVYDWRSRQWVHVTLSPTDGELPSPSRFISAGGALQVRLVSTTNSGDVVIADPVQDVQLSGTATVS